MIKRTFCHIPKISITTEAQLWDQGIKCWEDLQSNKANHIPKAKKDKLDHFINESIEHLNNDSLAYFFQTIPKQQHWRVFPTFRTGAVYLDIETSGLNSGSSYITTISTYDGKEIKCYVKDQNLQDFVNDINQYKIIITYNGKCFDIPFIESYFRINLDIPHIDLRYVLHSLGYKGGLKGCEKQLGISRNELEGVDGYFAVLLWKDYKINKNLKALDTLLAYNIADVINLEKLMVMAYNLNLKETPFSDTIGIPEPAEPIVPYIADLETINRIKSKHYGSYH